jgi:hypothetical protein
MLRMHVLQPRAGDVGALNQGSFSTGEGVTATSVAMEALAALICALGKLDLTVRTIDADHSQFKKHFYAIAGTHPSTPLFTRRI